MGGKLLLQMPITIVAPGKGTNFLYQPFVAGAQYVDDSDEAAMYKADDQGFTFTPLYPVATELPEEASARNAQKHDQVKNESAHVVKISQVQEIQDESKSEERKQMHSPPEPQMVSTSLTANLCPNPQQSADEKYEILMLTKEAADMQWQPLDPDGDKRKEQSAE